MRNTIAVWLLLAASCYGQIDVAPSVEPYKVIPATVTADVPEGAKFDGGWEVSPGVSYLEHDAKTIHLTAAPGEHTLSYAGFWIHTKTVTFTVDGQEISIESYLGHGRVNESATFTVPGGADPDLPQPIPPQPAGKKSIVFFLDLAQREKLPEAQRWLVTGLNARKKLEALGHRYLQIIDDDQIRLASPSPTWKAWIDAVKDDPLPRVAFAPIEGGPIVDYPMPVDYNRLLELLGETP